MSFWILSIVLYSKEHCLETERVSSALCSLEYQTVSSGVERLLVRWKSNDVSEEHLDSIFQVEE
jgi:hypothetical protein